MPWRDPRILREIVRQSRFIDDPRAAEVFRRAGAQVGLVESGGANLGYGDADSQNWRQEREAIYGPAWARSGGPLNTRASVRRFRQEFMQHYDPGEKAYEVAAQVQRPAAQYRGRYRDVAGEALRLLRGEGASSGGGGGGMPSLAPAGGQSALGEAGSVLGLLQALQGAQRGAQASSGGLAAPAHSAGPVLPQGAQQAMTGGGPAPKPDVQALMAAIRSVGAGTPGVPGVPGASGGPAPGGGQPSGGGGRLGKVSVAPGADRAGVHTNRAVLRFAREVAGIAGMPVTIGTGTNHSQMTVNGNVSQHWTGDAADIPAAGRRLIRLGQAALIAAGMPKKKARQQRGGLYNVGGRQIIFATNEGGNHFDHLHIGL